MIKISKQYIAGFFDGEGCIGIYKRKDRRSGKGSCARIQVTQNKSRKSTEILNYMLSKYGGNLSEQITLSGKIKYNWQLNPGGARKFLKDLFPYLILKKEQALIAIYWIDNRPKIRRDERGRVMPFTKEENILTDKIISLLKYLKKGDLKKTIGNQKDLVEIVTKLEPMAVIKK